MKYLLPLIAILLFTACRKQSSTITSDTDPIVQTLDSNHFDSSWGTFKGASQQLDSVLSYSGGFDQLSLSMVSSVSKSTKYSLHATCKMFTVTFDLPDSLISRPEFHLHQQLADHTEDMYINMNNSDSTPKVLVNLTWSGSKGKYGKTFSSDD